MVRFLSSGKHLTVPGFVLFACCVARAPAHAQSPRLTRDEVVASMVKQARTFTGQRSWMVHYTNARDNVDPAPGSEVHWPPCELVNARTQDGWIYLHVIQSSLDGSAKQHHWISWKDKVCVDRIGESVSITPEPSATFFSYFYYPAFLWVDVFADIQLHTPDLVRALGTDRPSNAFPDAFTTSVVRNQSSYNLRAEQEEVDGGLCYVLERPKQDVIWIDPALGFVSRKRTGYNKEGTVSWECKNEQFKDCGGGVWLPQKQHLWIYNPPNAPPEKRGKVAVHQTNNVAEIRLNDVPASLFDIEVPENARIRDFIRGVGYQRPGTDLDPLATAVEQAREGGVQNAGGWAKVVVIALLVAGLLPLAYLLGRRRFWGGRPAA